MFGLIQIDITKIDIAVQPYINDVTKSIIGFGRKFTVINDYLPVKMIARLASIILLALILQNSLEINPQTALFTSLGLVITGRCIYTILSLKNLIGQKGLNVKAKTG